MIYKRDYNDLMKNVDRMMSRLNAEKDSNGAYHFDTACGKMRVKVDDFKPKKDYLWVFTQVENPEKVPECYRNCSYFNNFSGKHNMYSRDIHFLYHWLWEYVVSCLPEGKRIDY